MLKSCFYSTVHGRYARAKLQRHRGRGMLGRRRRDAARSRAAPERKLSHRRDIDAICRGGVKTGTNVRYYR